jgi:hypothetical protein
VPGFAVLDLDGPRMRVRYVDRDGAVWRPDDVVPAPTEIPGTDPHPPTGSVG